MITLETNETFVNSTDKTIYYKVCYINAVGNEQIEIDKLEPTQSLTKTNTVNAIQILLP